METPSYYGGKDAAYQPRNVWQAWALPADAAQALKYIRRAGKKDPSKHIEDLQKSINCLNAQIVDLEDMPAIELLKRFRASIINGFKLSPEAVIDDWNLSWWLTNAIPKIHDCNPDSLREAIYFIEKEITHLKKQAQ
jgi:hypothetical protein